MQNAGYLRVFDYSKEHLICGGKSYYGALLCCAWRLVAWFLSFSLVLLALPLICPSYLNCYVILFLLVYYLPFSLRE